MMTDNSSTQTSDDKLIFKNNSSIATNTTSSLFTAVSDNFKLFESSMSTGSRMAVSENSQFSIHQPYANMESAAKKVKSMWLAKKVHGVKRSCLETIFEKTPLNVYHRTGINWLDFKRRQEEYRLCRCTSMNDTGRVGELLQQGVNPNCYDWQERTPLHLAASRGYAQMVRLLLKYGADPNLVDPLGNIPLHLAACTNNEDVVLLLLNAGTNVDSFDIRGRSPLELAKSKLRLIQMSKNNSEIKNKVTKIVEMLLLFLKKKNVENSCESELLESFQNRLKISETTEQVSNEIDNLSKMLEHMQCSTTATTAKSSAATADNTSTIVVSINQ